MHKKIIFIRDDDLYKIDQNFIKIFEFCLIKKIPIIYGIIPAKITPELTKLLRVNKKKYPHLIDIAQHGWKHKNYSGKSMDKSEFGNNRSYEQQKRDIKNGFQKMLLNFGAGFTPAFIPPYHGYNKTTLKIISELKIPIFSAEKTNFINEKFFLDLPAEISLNNYDSSGTPVAGNFTDLLKIILSRMNSAHRFSGFVFHHSALKQTNTINDIQKIFLLLNLFSRKKLIKIALFSDFIKKSLL